MKFNNLEVFHIIIIFKIENNPWTRNIINLLKTQYLPV